MVCRGHIIRIAFILEFLRFWGDSSAPLVTRGWTLPSGAIAIALIVLGIYCDSVAKSVSNVGIFHEFLSYGGAPANDEFVAGGPVRPTKGPARAVGPG